VDGNPGCPPARTLVELIDGQLVEPDLSELSRHLEVCPACQERARTLPSSDALVESLRGEAPAEDRIARAVPRPLIERLKQIPRREPRAASDAGGLSRDAAARPAGPELDFLAPEPGGEDFGRIGPYRLLEVLGRGGMGEVFLAEDPKLGRLVALKVMLPRLAANPTAKDRFLREARAAAGLKSDHIVTIYHVDEADGIPYLAMERLEGRSLEDVLRSGTPLRAAQVLRIARDIARGLAAAHEKGLIHRDIKPGNLWLEHPPLAPRDGEGDGDAEGAGTRVKILDFGLAWEETEDIHLTQTGAIVGTPAYIAPEQARGDRAVDARADLFSLGCVLYRLCAGDVPFKAETTMRTLLAIALDEPARPSRLNAATPPELCRLIMQLLEKDPDRRPRSARDVIARLAEIERSLRGGAAALSPPSLTPAPPPGGPPRRRRPRALAFAGLLSAALVALAAAVYFWQMPDGRVVRIECDDPAIRVAFEGGELKVAGAYKEPVAFKPGKVGLRVTRKGSDGDDFEFETDKLIVNRGDEIVLKVEVLEGKVQIVQAGKGVLDAKQWPVKTGPPAVAEADREAAEWVLSLGGSVKVDGRDVEIRAADGLPKGRFTLTTVNLHRITGLSDAGLAHLEGLTGLTILYMDHSEVTDAGLARLKDLPVLTTLILDATPVTDDGLAHLEGLTSLTTLGLALTRVTDDGLARLRRLRGLEELSLHGDRVSDAELGHLTDLRRLTVLNLNYTRVTDAALGRLKAITGLSDLFLNHARHGRRAGPDQGFRGGHEPPPPRPPPVADGRRAGPPQGFQGADAARRQGNEGDGAGAGGIPRRLPVVRDRA
jgi:eukaryotic-like serine/threonine-protein kinase